MLGPRCQITRRIASSASVGRGVFVQEPAACDWCDYTAVCGPRGLLERRRLYKTGDTRLQAALRLRDV